MDCLFCRIASGSIPSAEVADAPRAFAFLDINPLAPGHTLVVPKAHAAKLADLGAEDLQAVMALAQRVLSALASETGCPDATVAFNDGPGAGQEVPHVHLHVVPRRAGDLNGPIHAAFPRGAHKAETEELHDMAIRLQSRLEGRPLPARPGGR